MRRLVFAAPLLLLLAACGGGGDASLPPAPPPRAPDTRRRRNDFAYPLSGTADILRQADLAVVNLEAPLIEDCPPHEEGFVFCGQPGFAGALPGAGGVAAPPRDD